MDIPLETINSSHSCHFNSFCFTALQRLEGCHWNSNGYNSAFWRGRRGQASSSKLRSMWLDREDRLLFCCCTNVPTLSCETGDSFLTGEACFSPEKHWDASCWRCDQPYVVQLLSGAGNLHSPSPWCLEPSLQICITRLNSCFFSPWKHFECDIEPKCAFISTSFKFLSSPSLAEST